MHTSPRQLDTIFPTTVVETKAAKRQPAPASTHKQPTTRQQGIVKTTPASRSGLEPNGPKKEKIPQSTWKQRPKNKSREPGRPTPSNR